MNRESTALEELLNARVVDELKKLARLLTGEKLPTACKIGRLKYRVCGRKAQRI